jgi:drug/metabolite transporter (DMT)-like permease
VTARQAGLLATLAALWGSSYLLIKYALRGFSPAEVVWVRAAGAALVLWPICRLRGGATRAALGDLRRRPAPAFLLGLVFVAAPFLLISLGELHVPSGLTAILISPSPIFVALLALRLDATERATPERLAGLAVGFGGVVLLVGVETVQSLDEFLGALAVLGASACYATGSFVVKRAYTGTPPIVTATFAVTTAAVIVLPVALVFGGDRDPALGDVAAVVTLAVAHTGMAFIILYSLIAEVGPARANLVSYLVPPFALAYGAVFLSEDVTAAAIGGLLLILAGVALASRAAPRRV